jgi:hypothetical protein
MSHALLLIDSRACRESAEQQHIQQVMMKVSECVLHTCQLLGKGGLNAYSQATSMGWQKTHLMSRALLLLLSSRHPGQL